MIDDPTAGTLRLSDVAFDPEADGVTLVPSVPYLRTLGDSNSASGSSPSTAPTSA